MIGPANDDHQNSSQYFLDNTTIRSLRECTELIAKINDSISDLYLEKMSTLTQYDIIDGKDQLHDLVDTRKILIETPGIAVVGERRCGKSSVVEALIGIGEFLPKNTKFLSSNPIVITTKYAPEIINQQVVFEHLPNRTFSDLSHVREIIEKELMKNQNNNSNLSQNSVLLTIYSNELLNMTIIELPSITSVNLFDKKANNWLQTVETNVLNLIKAKNILILAICQSNVDIATSSALAIAKKADPEQDRTIGVITKLDLQEEHEIIMDILENKHFFLKNGFFCLLTSSPKITSLSANLVNMDDGRDYLHRKPITKYPYKANLNHQYGFKNLIRKVIQKIYLFYHHKLQESRQYLNMYHLNLIREREDFNKKFSDIISNNDPDLQMIRRILDISSLIGKLIITNFNVSQNSGVAFIKDIALLNKSPLVDCFKIIINVLPHLIGSSSPNLHDIIVEFILKNSQYKLDQSSAIFSITNALTANHYKIYLKCFDKLGDLFIDKIGDVLNQSHFDPFILEYIKSACEKHINSLIMTNKTYFMKINAAFRHNTIYDNMFMEFPHKFSDNDPKNKGKNHKSNISENNINHEVKINYQSKKVSSSHKKGSFFKRIVSNSANQNNEGSTSGESDTKIHRDISYLDDFMIELQLDPDFHKLLEIYSTIDEKMRQRLYIDIKYTLDQINNRINMTSHLVQCIMMSNIVVEFEKSCTDFINNSLIEAYKCGQIDIKDLQAQTENLNFIETKLNKLTSVLSEFEILESMLNNSIDEISMKIL